MAVKNQTTLGQISLEAVDGPFGSNLPASAYVSDGIPVIRGSNLSLGKESFKDSDFVYVSEATFEKLRRSECVAGDILFTKKGTLGQTGIIPQKHKFTRFLLSSNQMRLRVNREVALPEYVYYFVSSTETIEKIKRESESTGVPKINLEYLKSFPIYLPPLESQSKIVSVLQSLDKKIQLNNQCNQTLEQMAQALFKSWFVDFDPVVDNALAAGNPIPEELADRVEVRKKAKALPDFQPLPKHIRNLFPNEFEQTGESTVGINGWVPKGWGKTSFESLIKLIGGGTPKTSVEEYWNGKIPWFSVVDAPKDSDVFVLDTEKHISQLGVDNSSTKILRKGTTVISARGTVGKCALVGEPMAMNQSCYGIEGKTGIADTFIYFLTRYQVSDLQKRGHGSVFNTITRETFKTINLAFSGEELTLAFESLVKPYLDRILLNNRQVLELIRTRDVLLPKLISGEIKIDKEVA